MVDVTPVEDIDRGQLEALVRGDHRDPFAVLGMHPADGRIIVRAYLPNAASVSVIDSRSGRVVADIPRVHSDGVFAGPAGRRKRRFRYRLRVRWGDDDVEIDDPYCFPPVLGDMDVHLLSEGRHLRPQEQLGAHLREIDGIPGIAFAVWAPNAQRVSVVGPFNQWDWRRHLMRLRHGCGVWEIFIPGVSEGALYKYEIKGADNRVHHKADPFAFRAETLPGTASAVYDLADFDWQDESWMDRRESLQSVNRPISIYEVHLGSWRRKSEDGDRSLTYREAAEELVDYVADMGFTHIEFLPLTEHPFTGSWGYQPVGLYAATNRFGTPDDLRALVDACHAKGIGVLLDWVPAHFPADAHGLALFDGSHLFEHEDPRLGRHMDWDTLIYNFGRREVQNFLTANALYWLEQFHVDGLRVDAVASMLYLDYSRKPGQWLPNKYGGNENLEAIAFLRRMNEIVYGEAPGIVTVAEESTAWPMVSRPTFLGGLGFGFKWNMGWMHDTLAFMREDPVHRRYHHDKLCFGLVYAFSENFVLPLSHDEVVHGKGSLIGKMPGDEWQRFANLRAYFTFMFTHPGKKLLFMGGEFAQLREWNHDSGLDWRLLEDPKHIGIQSLVRDLNRLYRDHPALHFLDCDPAGFAWIDCNDSENNVLSYIRYGSSEEDFLIVVCNFTPVVRHGYQIGVPSPGDYRELMNSDAAIYGGSDVGNGGMVRAEVVSKHGRPASLSLTLPPLGVLVLAPVRGKA